MSGLSREIKFRAWNKKSKIMIPVEEISFWCNEIKNNPCGYTLSFDDCILMQYTGLKDSKGVEIYEGDILKFYSDKLNGWKVFELNYDGIRWVLGDMNKSVWGLSHCFPADYHKLEIIGNIYENPELLK